MYQLQDPISLQKDEQFDATTQELVINSAQKVIYFEVQLPSSLSKIKIYIYISIDIKRTLRIRMVSNSAAIYPPAPSSKKGSILTLDSKGQVNFALAIN